MSILEKNKEFSAAADYCALKASEFSNDELLLLYGLYKQALVGDIDEGTIPKFSFDMKKISKAKAWLNNKGMESEIAAKKYVEFIESKFPGWNKGKNEYKTKTENLIGIGHVSRMCIFNDEQENDHLMNYLLNNSIDKMLINSEEFLTSVGCLLCLQVAKNNEIMLRNMLDKNQIIVNCKDEDGNTPLHIASDRGFSRICLLLLEKGAHVNATDRNGESPLMLAVLADRIGVVELLISYNADIDLVSLDGSTVLEMDCCQEIKNFFKERKN